LHAYVDGSYIAGNVGYGLAIINDDVLVFEDFGSVNNPEYLEARQVAGELMAVGKVVQWCKQHGHASITIHYDYAGIREWALGNWRAKQALTQRYAQFMALSGLLINWNKIQAHTGDHWNEYVDKLAKKGTGQ
jgi:ribonuclease HI